MWNVLNLKPKKPKIDFNITGRTALEISEQQQREHSELVAEHVRRLKPLNEKLSKLGYPAGETERRFEADIKQQIQQEKDRCKAAFEALSAEHRKVNEARAQQISDIITRSTVPAMLNWLKDRETVWVEWLIEAHHKLREVSREFVVGPEMGELTYAVRMAEAMLLKNGPAKLEDYVSGLPGMNVGQGALWEALEAKDATRVSDALLRMEISLRDLYTGRRTENAQYAWRRRLVCDFMEF